MNGMTKVNVHSILLLCCLFSLSQQINSVAFIFKRMQPTSHTTKKRYSMISNFRHNKGKIKALFRRDCPLVSSRYTILNVVRLCNLEKTITIVKHPTGPKNNLAPGNSSRKKLRMGRVLLPICDRFYPTGYTQYASFG